MDENTDGRQLPNLTLGLVLLVMLIVACAGAYGVWFLAVHWHSIFPR